MRITATVQARVGSTRLPGKALRSIAGRPTLELVVERIVQSRLIDEVIIATPDSAENDRIEELARRIGVGCFRGSENDVLGRVTACLRKHQVELHVEFQGDNLLPDGLLIDSIIGFYLKHSDRYDYVTNALRTTYPPGSEVSVYPADVLLDAERHVTDETLREHVGIHIYKHPDRYRVINLEAPSWLRRPDLHLEIDTEEDFEVVRRVYEHFYSTNPGFSIAQVIEFADRTGIGRLNENVERRWRSFREDAP